MGIYTNRVEEEKYNKQGNLMKIIEYNNSMDVFVEFQDEYKATIHTTYDNFLKGSIKNPYYKSVFEVGIIGSKYSTWINNKHTKEYGTWCRMLERCYSKKLKEKRPTYENVTCCNEWMLFENFYEWLHSQSNFNKWISEKDSAIDKDILIKGNKIYSPNTCCLVPKNINSLFVKCNATRGDLPIGVSKCGNLFRVKCQNPFKNKCEYLGDYHTLEEAFEVYKQYKESIIKQVAKEEYNKGNITKRCYEAMINYKVEITD